MRVMPKRKSKALNLMAIVICILMTLSLGACVSDKRGLFNAETSDEKVLQDYLQLSLGYLGQQDLTNSRRHLNSAMEIDSNNSTAYGIWGLLYSAEGDRDLADDSFRRSLKIDSSNSQVRNNYAAFLFLNGRFEEAYSQLERVVADTNYPARAQAFQNMGLAARQLNDLEGAEYAFGRALQLNSNQLQANLELTEINIDKGDYSQAQVYYNSFLILIQLYNVEHSARSLWAGIQIEQAIGNIEGEDTVSTYTSLLENDFPQSVEFNLYQQSQNN